MEKIFIRKFRSILRRFEREVLFQNNESCCNDVSLAQCHTLVEVDNHKEISLGELANILSLDKSTVSRTVDSLVKTGFLNRKTPSENRRITQLSLTPDGKKSCDAINNSSDEYIAKSLSVLNSKEQEVFLNLFEKVTEGMSLIRKEND